MTPKVSAIITTCRRPELVGRAVESALAQTLKEIEVIVVVDGPDDATLEALAGIGDERLSVHVREKRGGQPAAINTGVELARGEWIALLDDDDEWFAGKLEAQLKAAERSRHEHPVVCCRYVARSEKGEVVRPTRLPEPGEPVSEYLFRRTRLAYGEGALQPSTFLAQAELWRRNPMDERLYKHADLDWLVRTCGSDGAGLEVAGGKPLSVWNELSAGNRLSTIRDWRFSYEWASAAGEKLTPRALAGFLLTWVSLTARMQGEWSALPFLFREAFTRGAPGWRDVAIFASICVLPHRLRGHLSRSVDRMLK